MHDYDFNDALDIALRLISEEPELWHGDDRPVLTADSSL